MKTKNLFVPSFILPLVLLLISSHHVVLANTPSTTPLVVATDSKLNTITPTSVPDSSFNKAHQTQTTEQDKPPNLVVTKNTITKLLELDLTSLSNLSVYTPNRTLTPIEKSPSVISLITAKQIKRQGFSNLHEVLARVPGFFNATSPYMEIISNRGFAQNNNTNYLLLVDSVTLNNNADAGISHLPLMPGLDDVQQIEIVRDPSSTLWGANSTMGIIHIITKKADSLIDANGTIEMSVDYEKEQKRKVLQSQYRKSFKNGGITLSGTFFNSDAAWTKSYTAGTNALELQTSRQMNLWDFENSHKVYLKLNWKQWKLKVSDLNFNNFNPFLTDTDGLGVTTWKTKRQWIELSRNYQLSPTFDFQWRIYNKAYLDETSFTKEKVIIIRPKEEKGYGGEAIIHYRENNHHFLFGLTTSRSDLSSEQKKIAINGSIDQSEVLIPLVDKNRALFFGESYKGFKDWIINVGLRVDESSPRANKVSYLPRFAAAYSLNQHWNAKYAFNTGYVAPTLTQRSNGIRQVSATRFDIGAERIQESRSHDIQFLYHNKKTSANITLFHQTLSDVIQFAGKGPFTIRGLNNVFIQTLNSSDMTTWGLELEAKHVYNKYFTFYGNYAFANASYDETFTAIGSANINIIDTTSVATDDLRVTGTPRHILNLGTDWSINSRINLNTHLRAWHDIDSKDSEQPTFKHYGTYYYLDFNLNYQPERFPNLNLSTYLKNALDNTDPIPGGVNSGEVEPQNSRQIGLKINYTF